jgi:hypothetical protein
MTDHISPEPITTWAEFSIKIRSKGCNLLKELDKFPNSVLITGCQRSGTTMLARVIRESEGIVDYWAGRDDELDAALILSGYVAHQPRGRYCFQTTYLNQCYHEYFEHPSGHKILWVLRNPYSTVYSLLYNWPSQAVENTFRQSVSLSLTGKDKWLYKLGGDRFFSKLKKACLHYNWKVSQLFDLVPNLGNSIIKLIDYDNLVQDKEHILPQIYKFINLPYQADYAGKIHSSSVEKKKQLKNHEVNAIKYICEGIYLRASSLTNL